jgi:hypothetical protein
MVIIKMVRRKTTVSIDRAQMAEIMEILDCNDPHQAFGMLSLALSLLYRDCWEEQVTIEEFTERTGKQISVLIRDPPSGFREEDIGQPTPGCNCPVCEAIRARNERKANVTRH